MDNYNEEISELLINNVIATDHLSSSNASSATTPNITNNSSTRSNSQPIPANRLALAAQIEAAAEHQRRLKRKRRIYYIVSIVTITMITFFIISFVAWIIHNSGANQEVIAAKVPSQMSEIDNIVAMQDEVNKSSAHWHTLNARKHPTRTVDEKTTIDLIKRSELESDEDKDTDTESDSKSDNKTVRKRSPTRTRQLSYAPEKMIDYKAHTD